MVNPNKVIKIQNFTFFYKICNILDMSSAVAYCIYHAAIDFIAQTKRGFLLKFVKFQRQFTNFQIKTRHVCTYLNAFLMVNPNMVMKINNFKTICKICNILNMSSAVAYRMVGVNGGDLSSESSLSVSEQILSRF